MSKILERVEAHNKKVEELMKKKTVTEAQRTVLLENIKGKLSEYKEKYGVDLRNADIAECARLVKEEYYRVMNQIKEEYEKSTEVVSLIESGKVAEARKLLGVDNAPEPVVEEKAAVVEEVVKPVVEEKPVVTESVVKPVEEIKVPERVVEEPKKEEAASARPSITPEAYRAMMEAQETVERPSRDVDEEDIVEGLDDDYMTEYDEKADSKGNEEEDDDFGFEFEDEDEEESEVVAKESDEDDDFGFSFGGGAKKVEAPVKVNPNEGLTSVEDAVKEVETTQSGKGTPKMPTGMGFSFDDEDDDDMGFNFKNLLAGSKFEI